VGIAACISENEEKKSINIINFSWKKHFCEPPIHAGHCSSPPVLK
jgi:hypothetical protein